MATARQVVDWKRDEDYHVQLGYEVDGTAAATTSDMQTYEVVVVNWYCTPISSVFMLCIGMCPWDRIEEKGMWPHQKVKAGEMIGFRALAYHTLPFAGV